MNRKVIFVFYMLTVIVLAGSTLVEHANGTGFAARYIYGAWWFSLLWMLLAVSSLPYILKLLKKDKSKLLLHLSFFIMLAGALLTHLLSTQGVVHLRQGQPVNAYTEQIADDETDTARLPFTIELTDFEISYHPGTKAASDYTTHFTIKDDGAEIPAQVSMNKVFDYAGYRFYQSSYDADGQGSYVTVKSDRYGTPVTYMGYALLFLSLIWLLIRPKGTFRQLLKSPILRKCAVIVFALFSAHHAAAAPSFPKSTADKFGRLYILHNDRICPLQTYAMDFTKKLCGKDAYQGMTAEQVLMGFIFWRKEWDNEKILKVKDGAFKDEFHLGDYVSLNDLFSMGSYRLKAPIEEYYNGNKDAYHKAAAALDEKVNLVMELQNGTPLAIFPYRQKGRTEWYAPNQEYPADIDRADIAYWQGFFSTLYADALSANNAQADEAIKQLSAYQQRNGGNSLPDVYAYKAERLYNALPLATILFMFNLTIGFFAFAFLIYRLMGSQKPEKGEHTIRKGYTVLFFLLLLSFLVLSYTLGLRWMISGNIPMANGYETMLTVAWLTQLLALVGYQKARILIIFGFLLSGFFLLVSHISQMDPAIGQMMPVLNSPLLSVHVSIIMMSYALLSITFICGLTALLLHLAGRITPDKREAVLQQAEALQVLSRIFLYPAVSTLGIGIFIGAIWANMSWGTYWSWDPKETWALITFMVYAVVLHTHSLPAFKQPFTYHLYITLAFLTILITYFGVNYILGGMHSYA
ncbi:cytochrome c biogenesis protein CcsA [Prevotella multiformis]|uniref:Putative cytochrome c-type biogenesis protein CcsB n=1 Tax=Prevotella multiformis DSM 16608 TaxID=888743 RepID=F0F5P1_9BACT|nr:cytochrome c biogenesis protein CcsA [Prevotella multiformis]EGC20660.1 putative cytochrome c-type biogenesis protein CcsB [Prevotella multiformis DSM 16608]